MANVFRTSTSATSATPLTLNVPAGVVNGDVLIMFVASTVSAPSTPAGWTQLDTGTNPAGNFAAIYRRVASGEPANYQITAAGGSLWGMMLASSGSDVTTPEDATTTVGTGTASPITVPSITTVTDNATHIIFVFQNSGDTPSTPTNYTADVALTVIFNFKRDITPAGLVTGVQSTVLNPSWRTYSYALRPAVAASAVISQRVPGPKGPSSRAFHMLQRIPTVPLITPAPFALTDWQNPWGKPNPLDTRTIADASEFWMLRDTFFGSAGQPPANLDWPNPNRGATPSVELRTWLQNTVRFLGLDRFFGAAGQAPANLDWPVPKGRPYPLSTWLLSLNQLAGKDTFFGAAGQPPPNLDWPNPTRAAVPNIDLRSWLQSLKQNLLGQDRFFSAPGVGPNYDWPNPLRSTPVIELRTWIQNLVANLATVVFVFPFNLLDWPITLGKTPNPTLKTHIDPLKTNLQGQDMFFGLAGQPPTNLDWPVPKGPTPSIGLRSHIVNLLQSTLLVIVPATIKRIVYDSGRLVYKLSAWLQEDL